MKEALWIALVGVVVVIVVVIRFAVRSERRLGTPTQRARTGDPSHGEPGRPCAADRASTRARPSEPSPTCAS